jgi:hypothetical protein
MPELEAARGMIVGYVLEETPEIGCVTRVDESGIWVVRGVRSIYQGGGVRETV